ncbi:Hpt domain-containing protein [Sulfitobacter sp. S190]|uniref:Hpt domain-containing protein n=1 Tax=Sulfitobacter sp. S190 TaxID=2867022 RepID=UPI0021A6F3FF|nr:Hpt domain-containing protein [Sulfitobacter sp. S190]UWR22488.1 Hpt domain-containing protein [Sulfitobacter sp. S190]
MIDWDHINTLRNDIGPDEFEEVIEIFLEEVEGILLTLPDRTDPRALTDELHAIKGCALNLGFTSLANLCQEGENRIAASVAHKIDVTPLTACYETSKKMFLSGLPKAMAG